MKYKRVRNVLPPERAHGTDSGIDFFVPKDISDIINERGEPIEISKNLDTMKSYFLMKEGDNLRIPLGVCVELEEGYDLQFVNKSGIASKFGIILGAQLVDRGYDGELVLNLIKVTPGVVKIDGGMKIAQGVVRPVNLCIPQETGEIYSGERGDNGFGSTGI